MAKTRRRDLVTEVRNAAGDTPGRTMTPQVIQVIVST